MPKVTSFPPCGQGHGSLHGIAEFRGILDNVISSQHEQQWILSLRLGMQGRNSHSRSRITPPQVPALCRHGENWPYVTAPPR